MGKIVIREIERPDTRKPDAMIRWFCAVFDLGDDNEVDSLEAQMLGELIKAGYRGEGMSSSEIKLAPKVPRSTVIYHLNRLLEIGVLVKKGRKYYMRATEMSKVMEEIEYDMEREMRRMIDTAREFDKLMQRRFRQPFKELK
jgi:predicted transcriptional regulator